jgi:hypothetical protein
MICSELSDFLSCVETRRQPGANVDVSGVLLGRVMEAFYQSAKEERVVALDR